MRILLLIALRNLLGARRRSALLGTAVGMVTLILVLMGAWQMKHLKSFFEAKKLV